MTYLKFDKKELVNLEYSLKREYLATNYSGGYLNTTISGCNTRKYHGLLVLPIENFDNKMHLLLSSLDETLIQHNKHFNLGIHCYGEVYEPRGHKYIVSLEIDKVVSIIYSVGGILFKKVVMLMEREEQVIISYTLLEAHSPTTLRLKPFLAFRDVHLLSKANMWVNTKWGMSTNGRNFRLYDGFPNLHLQLNVESEFISNPMWYYDIEYKEESRRVYDSREDLWVPGYFELPIEKGETIYFSASTKEEDPSTFKLKFESQYLTKKSRDSFLNTLKISAKQFIVHQKEGVFINAGYPWLNSYLRETLIFVPWLTLSQDIDKELFISIVDSTVKYYYSELTQGGEQTEAPLWLFWALQNYVSYTGELKEIWQRYGPLLIEILNSYKNGHRVNITMHENGLLWGQQSGRALTWMNAYAFGNPITERAGYQVETNALWYNALCFAIELAEFSKESSVKEDWQPIVERLNQNFIRAFWIEQSHYLADYVGPDGQNKAVRPNQLIAATLKFSPLNEEEREAVLNRVTKELLTTKGVRTLSPRNPLYKGEYDGDQLSRDMAYHQGTTRAWLLAFYFEAMFDLYGEAFLPKAQELLSHFEEELSLHCIGSISEVFDGDPPHQPHGAPSYSGSIASLLRSIELINKYKGGAR